MKAWIPLLLIALLACARPLSYALRPAAAGPRGLSTQEVLVHLPGGEEQRFLTTVENDGRRLTLVASTPVGQTLFVIRVEDGKVDADRRVPLPRAFDPTLLPALVQVCDWPLEEARRGLPRRAELREEGGCRTLLLRGKPFLEIRRQAGRTRLDFPGRGLAIDLTPLDD
jgi:hypothetical protein